MFAEEARLDALRVREAVYVDVLVAYQRFRSFVMTEEAHVVLAADPDNGNEVPVIDGARPYFDAVRTATARLLILDGPGSPVHQASRQLWSAQQEIARARARRGSVLPPDAVVSEARRAEHRFAEVARSALQTAQRS